MKTYVKPELEMIEFAVEEEITSAGGSGGAIDPGIISNPPADDEFTDD